MKHIINCLLFLLLFSTSAYAWESQRTHTTLSEFAAMKYFGPEFMEQSINGRRVRLWVRDGADLEDAGTSWQFVNGTARGINHFHNPTKILLEDAGLTDRANGISALIWAQNGPYQTSLGLEDWSWQRVRQDRFNYLTGTDNLSRDTAQANMLVGLGHQMHLVQDMGHPSHVRNNTHIIDAKGWGGFETWTSLNDIRSQILNVFPAPKVAVDLTAKFDNSHDLNPAARLSDTRNYLGTTTPTVLLNQGLAEYTNSNFFSQDTIFAAERFSADHNYKYYFPYPRKEGTDVQQYINRTKAAQGGIYISKTGEGEQLTYLAREGVSTRWFQFLFGTGKWFYGSFKLDENCYQDYAQKLLPRAVGYSAALLDYFFRGTIDLQVVSDSTTFRKITVTAKNNTAQGDEMPGGQVSLVIRYKELLESGTGPMRILNFPSDEYKYRVITLPDPVAVPKDKTVKLAFDLSADPLPLHITEVTLQLVYKGVLGNENGAVAVGSKNLEEIGTDIDVSLPPSGVYAKTTSTSPFNEVRVTAQSSMPGGLSLSDGVIELVLEYRMATSDPFASFLVDTEPQNADSFIIRIAEKNGVKTLPQGVPVELQFNLSSAPLPFWATDVYVNIVYRSNGDPESKSLAIGFHDISEPTPVDFFNNTDYVCLGGQWYQAGTNDAIVAADNAGNHNHNYDDDIDTYKHDFTNIYEKNSSTGNPVNASASTFNLLETGPVPPATLKRMGYILTDYYFNYSFLANWVHTNPNDVWWRWTETANLFSGTAVINQTDSESGDHYYPRMFNMRGKLMWSGAGVIYQKYLPANFNCDYATLPTIP